MFNFITYNFFGFLKLFYRDGKLVIPDFFYDLDNHIECIVIVYCVLVYFTTFATNTNQNVFFGIDYLRFFFKFVMRVFF